LAHDWQLRPVAETNDATLAQSHVIERRNDPQMHHGDFIRQQCSAKAAVAAISRHKIMERYPINQPRGFIRGRGDHHVLSILFQGLSSAREHPALASPGRTLNATALSAEHMG
jgi:hypothetical protein